MTHREIIKVGIIGVGQVGKRHVERYQQLSGVEILAVADIDEAEAARVAQANGIPQAFTDVRDLLAIDEIHAVDVCLHNNLHAPASTAAMEAGKHVFCEKPMTRYLGEAWQRNGAFEIPWPMVCPVGFARALPRPFRKVRRVPVALSSNRGLAPGADRFRYGTRRDAEQHGSNPSKTGVP